jgi:hypothetical protein
MDIIQDKDTSEFININISTQSLNELSKFINQLNDKLIIKKANAVLDIDGDNIVKVSPYKISN